MPEVMSDLDVFHGFPVSVPPILIHFRVTRSFSGENRGAQFNFMLASEGPFNIVEVYLHETIFSHRT